MTVTPSQRHELCVGAQENPNDPPMFRELFEWAPDATVIVNSDARILLVNHQAETLFGYERSELIGQDVEILVPPRYRLRHLGLRSGYFADPRMRPMGTGLQRSPCAATAASSRSTSA